MMQKRMALFCAAIALAPAAALAQSAGNYPTKPIRLIVPYPPGGGSDTVSRAVARPLSDNLGQQVVVDNRGGAGGNIGMELAAKSPPDGHTLVFALTAQLAINPALYRKIPYDPIGDFEPITQLASGPYILVVHPSLPAKSVKELIALARSSPGKIAYASSGNGSGGHLANELLNSMTGIEMQHIPYKGGGPALVDVLAGNVKVLFATWSSSKAHIENGRLRALGVSTEKRLSGVDIPTLAESGVPGFDAGVWYAFLAPKGTPKAIVSKLNTEIIKAANHPDAKKILDRGSIELVGSSPAELAKFMKSELAKWSKVVKQSGMKVD